MRVFLSSDLEGAAGIVDWDQCRPGGGRAYEVGCRLLLGEVNAAIEGAIAGGATSILVNDSHGAMANLPPDEIAGSAEYLSGQHKPLYMMEGLDAGFDAVMFVASHTYNPRAIWEVRLGGHVVGESGINALVATSFGVPIVFLSGDQVACSEARRFLPGCELVTVKESVTRFAGRSLHPTDARALIADGAERAMRRLGAGLGGSPSPGAGSAGAGSAGAGSAAALSLPLVEDSPCLEIDWLTADMAELACSIAGVERTGARTVEISELEPLACYRAFVATIAITRSIVES